MSKKKDKSSNKDKQLHIRLSLEEYNLIRERSKAYQSISSFVLDALLNYDVRRGRNRIDTMIKFSELMTKSDVSLARIGNNINQIAHEMNRQRLLGINLVNSSSEYYMQLLEESVELQKSLLLELRRISNER